MGIPWASVCQLRLTPPLARLVGLGLGFHPLGRRLVLRAVERSPFQVQANHVVVFTRGPVPEAREQARFNPLLIAAVERGTLDQFPHIQCFSLTTRAQNKKMASSTSQSSMRRRRYPKGWGLGTWTGKSREMRSHSASEMRNS